MRRNRLISEFTFLAVAILLSSKAFGQIEFDTSLTSDEGDIIHQTEFWDQPTRVGEFSSVPLSSLLFSNFATANSNPDGDMPRDLAVTPDGSKVFMANRDTDNVSIFDVDTMGVNQTINVGDFPVDIEISPDGQFAVVPNVFSNSVSVIDIETFAVTEIPITGEQPYTVRISSDSSFAYVGVINDAINSSISVINLATLSEALSFPTVPQGVIGFFGTPEPGISGSFYTQFELSADQLTLVIPDRGSDQVARYDVLSGIEMIFPVADAPTSVDISDDGQFAIIGHQGTQQVISVIDLFNNTVAEIPTSDTLRNGIIRFSPDQQFAVGSYLNDVVFVNLATGINTVINTGSPGDIEFSFDGQYAFVSNFNARVIDLNTLALADTISFAPCADAVTSPTELRAFALNNRFREDLHVYNINGPAGFFEGRFLSGEIEEGDATRTIALTPDGRTAVAANITSNNAIIIDACSGNVESYVPTGERSAGIAITPDGQTAVVCSLEDDRVSIIDIASGTNLVDLSAPQRPSEVAISPDGQMAYVTSVQGTDRIHFIQLDGANSSVVGSIIAGQMGSVIHTFNVSSGITVSPDNSVVGVCISFDDELLLIDTNTLTEIDRVPVGDFPIRVTFSADSQTAYVTNRFGDSVSIVDINGTASTEIDVVPGITAPLDVVLDATGAFGFVGNFDGNSPSIKVFNTSTGNVVNTVATNDSPRRLIFDALRSDLLVATTGGEFLKFDASGSSLTLSELTTLTSAPSDMAFSSTSQITAVALPIPDGVDLISSVLRGDVNLDGVVDLLDVAPLVQLIVSGNFQAEGDVNKSGTVDLLDVDPFVDILTGS